MAAEMTPSGSTRSRRVPSHTPPKPWKYHHGIPFCVLTTVVSGPNTGLTVAQAAAVRALLPRENNVHWSHISSEPAIAGRATKSPSTLFTCTPCLHGAKVWTAGEESYIESGAGHAGADIGSDCPGSRDQEFHASSFMSIFRERGGDGATANLSGRGRGNAFHQINLGRTFIFRQRLAAMLDQCRFGRCVGFVQDYCGGHFLAQRRMHATNVTAAATAGCRSKISSTSCGAMFSPPRMMMSLIRAGQVQVAVGVEESFITGSKPSIHKSTSVGFGLFS